MSRFYTGAHEGKHASTKLLHDCLNTLAPYSYYHGKHAYLSGQDAGDIQEAAHRGVNPSLLFGCDKNEARIKLAKKKLPLNYRKCLIKKEYSKMVKSTGDISVMFLDTCGGHKGAISLLKKSLPGLRKNGYIVLNTMYGRAGDLTKERELMAKKLSLHYSGIDTSVTNPIAQAMVLTQELQVEGINLYFHTVISYMNTGKDRKSASPMLITIGSLVDKPKAVIEPAYYVQLRNGEVRYNLSSDIGKGYINKTKRKSQFEGYVLNQGCGNNFSGLIASSNLKAA